MTHETLGDSIPRSLLIRAPSKTKTIDTAEAFQIVIELARQNVADQLDSPEHYKRQTEAINIIEDLAVNEYGDD